MLGDTVPTWRPIATHDGNTEHSIIGWEPGLDEPVEMARIDRDWYTRSGMRMFPTHWMPLPSPPVEAPPSAQTHTSEHWRKLRDAIHLELHDGTWTHTTWDSCRMRDHADRIIQIIIDSRGNQ